MYAAVFSELKRRIQVLKLSNHEKLLNKIGIKSASKGKFENNIETSPRQNAKQKMDYDIKLKEILEISNVFTAVLEYKLQAENHSIARNNFKVQNPTDYFREFVQFIFENLDKPLIIPTDNYIQ